VEDNLSASSSFIAYAQMPFTRKKRLFEKKYEPIGGRPPPPLSIWIHHW